MADEIGEIVVTGNRIDYLIERFRFLRFPTIDEGSGTGGGQSIVRPPNLPEIPHSETSECPVGAAEQAAEKIKYINEGLESQIEIGGIVEERPDGSFGISGNGLHTNYSRTVATIPIPENIGSIRGVIHNHVYDKTPSGVSRNFQNRYPSDQDWDVLEALSNPPDGGPGATEPLSIFLLDPFGTLREFKAADRATFDSLTDSDRAQGRELPDETNGCPKP